MKIKVLKEQWGMRSQREQLMLIACIAVLLVGLLFQLFWVAWHAKEGLRKKIPQQQMQLHKLENGRREWQRLADLPIRNTKLFNESLRKQIVDKASAIGLTAEWRGINRVELHGQCSFDAWLKWAAQLYNEHGLSIQRAKVSKLTPGIVSLDAELGVFEQ